MTRSRPDLDVSAYTFEYPSWPVEWSEVFGGDPRPIELEIGPGKGLFLASAAMLRPHHDFVGIEVTLKYARATAERLAKLGLTNARSIAGDGRRFLAEFVPARSLRAIHVSFPDPWWKLRHRKRRVVCPEFVADAARTLVDGGELHLTTDVEEYFEVMLSLVGESPAFAPLARPISEAERACVTNFERKYRIEGRSIHRVAYQRRAEGRIEP